MGRVINITSEPNAQSAQNWDGIVKTNDPRLFINRELSSLSFIERVLEQADNEHVPLLERLRFLGITCLLLDEFFEVRVAALRQKIAHGAANPGPDGLTPHATLASIRERAVALLDRQYRLFNDGLKPELEKQDIRFLLSTQWTRKQRQWLHGYFRRELLPVLSPLGLDPAHPFPRLLTKSLNFAVELQGKDAFGREGHMALVRAPRSLPRVIHIPSSYTRGKHDFVFLSSVIQSFMDELFPGMNVLESYQFRVTRDSELLIDDEDVVDLRNALESELAERGFSAPVRLETAASCPLSLQKFLAGQFNLQPDDIYLCEGPVNLNRLNEAIAQIDRPDLKHPAFVPSIQASVGGHTNLFEVIRRRDVLLHHPYQSFQTVIDLLRQASRDPNVLAIKQTLYRTGIDSHIVSLLVDAARAGKDVTVVVELRARFDEEANISLATRLQEAGVQVVYGVVDHKTHAKMLMIVRRERRTVRRYVHLGTGNYHSGTAQLYTDLGLLTCNQEICEDVHNLFLELTGLAKEFTLKKLLHSPFTLHEALLEKIHREAENAGAGKPSGIDAKMNSLTEPKIIRALYEASQAGVPVRLLVRGICRLRPGVPGFSDNIQVRSVIGRFLEHSRVFRFENDGEPETWCSSADWMERNLFQRVETAFPILSRQIARRIQKEVFDWTWQDSMEGWDLQADGSYRPVEFTQGTKRRHPQRKLLKKHKAKVKPAKK